MPNDLTPQFLWDDQLTPKCQAGPDWIWQGLLARGMCTLLTGHGKAAGKTTLLSLLLDRRGAGGTLAGLNVAPGKTILVSEESREIWEERLRRHRFSGNVCICPQPFLGIPTPAQWQALVEQIRDLHGTHGADLAVVDPLAPFVTSENNAQSLLTTLLPLHALTRARMGVLLLHHPGKTETRVGLAARGSTALLGHVDISIDMRRPRGSPDSRRRRFLALSRFSETPRQLLLELNAAATDYVQVAADDVGRDDFQTYLAAFQMVLEDAPQKLTRGDILAEWPPDFDKPGDTTLKRWLSRAVERGLIQCEGTGRKADPFRYWLPATEEKWRARNPLYDHFDRQQREEHWPWVSLQQQKRISRADDYREIREADASDEDGDLGPESE